PLFTDQAHCPKGSLGAKKSCPTPSSTRPLFSTTDSTIVEEPSLTNSGWCLLPTAGDRYRLYNTTIYSLLYRSNVVQVVLSEHNLAVEEGFEQVFNVSRIVLNPSYNSKTYNGDIMLLKEWPTIKDHFQSEKQSESSSSLSRPVSWNAYVQPAFLPDPDEAPLDSSTSCTVSGWGVTRIYSFYLSPVLRAVDVDYIPNCQNYYSVRVTDNMICAGSRFGGKDSCQGDSGGPLICNGNLEGIVSWGIGCANPYYPGVYTKVRSYIRWINGFINDF
ncbi:hypothetical protein NFI96_022192, partial [Prochilodus magdalenae]